MRSSIWAGSSWGTLARTSVTTWAVRSSGRHVTSEPLLARPIGVRPVATMTASGIRGSFFGSTRSSGHTLRAHRLRGRRRTRDRPGPRRRHRAPHDLVWSDLGQLEDLAAGGEAGPLVEPERLGA